MLSVAFRLLRAWFTRGSPEHVVVYDVTTLAAYEEIPQVQRILLRAQEENDVELLMRVQAAKEELARNHDNRRRNAAHPVLEGSPTTYGWKVEERAQSLAIQRGLEDAFNGTIFEPHQPRITPLPLDGHSMKEMFYEYHENNPQLRNLPPSRRNAQELIFTIEGTRWKITLSSSQANSIANDMRGDDALQDPTNLPGSPSSTIRVPTARRGSILDTDFQTSPNSAEPVHRPTTPTPPPPPSAYLARSLPSQQRVPLARSMSRSSRIPRVASKLSVASHTSTDIQADESGACTSHEEESPGESRSSSASTSRAASPARSALLIRPSRSGSASRLSASSTLRRPSAIPACASSVSGTIKSARKSSGKTLYTRTSLGADHSHFLRPASPSPYASAPSSSLPTESRPSSSHSLYMDSTQYCLPPPSPRRGSTISRPSSRLAQRTPSIPQHRLHREASPSPSLGSTASSFVHTPPTPRTPLSEVRSMRSSISMRARKPGTTTGMISGSSNQQVTSQICSLPRRKRSSTVSEESPTLSLNAARKRAMLVALRDGAAGSVDVPRSSRLSREVLSSTGMVRQNSTLSTGAESRANQAWR